MSNSLIVSHISGYNYNIGNNVKLIASNLQEIVGRICAKESTDLYAREARYSRYPEHIGNLMLNHDREARIAQAAEPNRRTSTLEVGAVETEITNDIPSLETALQTLLDNPTSICRIRIHFGSLFTDITTVASATLHRNRNYSELKGFTSIKAPPPGPIASFNVPYVTWFDPSIV